VSKTAIAAMPLGAIIIGVVLWAWGQPLISASGKVLLWVRDPWSSENSQQIADWYSLSHMIHGFLVALIGRALHRTLPWGVVIAVAIVSGVAWEIIEHTDAVLDRFRSQTIYQGYLGDSVLNAVSDYLFMLSGFLLASVIPVGMVMGLIVVMEALSAYSARDSLVLTTLRVVHPVRAITDWQDEKNPTAARARTEGQQSATDRSAVGP
jgi:hypothetical protein